MDTDRRGYCRWITLEWLWPGRESGDVMRSYQLGEPGPLEDGLVQAVLAGEKTAACSLWADWEIEGSALPEAGERQALVDSEERSIAIIELLGVELIAPAELAIEEGEGFSSVAEWRQAHERFWSESSQGVSADVDQGVLPDDAAVVVEHFRLASRVLSRMQRSCSRKGG